MDWTKPIDEMESVMAVEAQKIFFWSVVARRSLGTVLFGCEDWTPTIQNIPTLSRIVL